MKKLSLALLASGLIVALASIGFACDKDAQASKDGAKPACCAKGHADAAKSASCSKSAKAEVAKGEVAKGAHCSKAAGAEVAKAGGHSCSKIGATAAKSCPMAKGAAATEVAYVGKVLCEHCNLGKKDSCNPVFQAQGQEGYFSLCPQGNIDGAKGAGEHGTKLLDVKGVMCQLENGEKALRIDSFTVHAS